MHIAPQTWNDIEKRYRGLTGNSEVKESMLELVRYISQSDFAESLYPWTSMFVLRITQTKISPFHDPVSFLQISPLNDGSAEFRYVDTYDKSKQWVRIGDKGRLCERLESLIDQLHWRINVSK